MLGCASFTPRPAANEKPTNPKSNGVNNDLGLAKSNSEARRFIQSKAIKLNGELITDEKYTVTLENFKDSKEIEISLGKKKNIIIVIN